MGSIGTARVIELYTSEISTVKFMFSVSHQHKTYEA